MPLKNLLHVSFLVTLKGHKHGHVHIGNARIQRGGGGGYRESRTYWKTTRSIEESNWAPSPWKRLDPLTFLTPHLDSGKMIFSLK